MKFGTEQTSLFGKFYPQNRPKSHVRGYEKIGRFSKINFPLKFYEFLKVFFFNQELFKKAFKFAGGQNLKTF